MSEKIKLYNLDNRAYPSNQEFRSLQVFECPICGALTNLVYHEPMRYTSGSLRVRCPNDSDAHRILYSKRVLLLQPHPESYARELRKEVEDLLGKVKTNFKNDLLGNPDHNKRRDIWIFRMPGT